MGQRMKFEAPPEAIDGLDRSLAVFGIVVAFAAGPLLRYANPWAAFSVACWGAIGFGLSFSVRHMPMPWRWGGLAVAAVALLLMGVETVPLVRGIQAASAANDRRCLALQHDMLAAQPRRRDDPDLFQALGCRPQGEGSVYAPSVPPGKAQ